MRKPRAEQRDEWCERSWRLSRVELTRPVEAEDVKPERVPAEHVCCGGAADDDRQDCRPALRAFESAVAEGLLGPLDLKAVRRGAHHTGHLDRDRALADRLERVALSGEVVERCGGAVAREIVRLEPVAAGDGRTERAR